MGNIGSHSGNISQKHFPEEQCATHSFPRVSQPSRFSDQHKVLPDRDAVQKLRPTNNGEILQLGGTLSGRQNKIILDKSSELSSYESRKPNKTYASNERDPFHKSNAQMGLGQNISSQKSLHEQMKFYASEPDLRYPPRNRDIKDKKSKKKYKAPPPPQNFHLNEKSVTEWEENSSENDFPARKGRLFKTQAETKKNSSQLQKYSSIITNDLPSLRPNRLSLPELTEDFQREIKEATKRLRHIEIENKTSIKYNHKDSFDNNNHSSKEKLKTLDPNINKTENVRQKFKRMIEEDNRRSLLDLREETPGKESTPETSPTITNVKEQPRTFYFGMDDFEINNEYSSDVIDCFADNIKIPKMVNSSESDISSDIDSDENNMSKLGIDLRLRPILPKKQLEIPRFSPAAAWKLLSSMEKQDNSKTVINDEGPLLFEERIEKLSRPPPPSLLIGQRSSNDKSGDSGISGDDAIPNVAFDDSPDNVENQVPTSSFANNKQKRISWTPQQDLGDDSSIDESDNQKSVKTLKSNYGKPHIFSLSLPRDNHLAVYMLEMANPHYKGLQKLKRSVSGVLNNLSNKKDFVQANLTDEESINWFLSKSAPNSLKNGFHSLEMRKNHDTEQLNSGVNTSRVMYLPETETEQSIRDTSKFKMGFYSKSCEELNIEPINPIPLQTPSDKDFSRRSSRKPRKFTFQSTIRQIEKKRLSDKFSKEAEKREKKRLRELEAMQKVEEEFQKKRAKEKANIRQQLRLYCLDEDPTWSSLPPVLDIKDKMRSEPDGAVSSSTASSPISFNLASKNDNKTMPQATKELSEYNQIQRDYKEHRGNFRYIDRPRQATVHPQVTYNMPKAKGMQQRQKHTSASGARNTNYAESAFSDDSQNNSMMYYNKYAPITRF